MTELALTDLRCEYLVDPLGIDTPRPRLSWMLASNRRGERQTAYQVLVAQSRERLAANEGDLWDSGKVESDQSVHVTYDGVELSSHTQCYWKVRVWDKTSRASGWSAPARWSMGLLEPADWKAKWVGRDEAPAHESGAENGPVSPSEHRRLPARMLRREFSVAKNVKRATAYVCGLGYYELYLNGAKVGDHVLDPGLTDYAKRALYVTYDVTERLKRGDHAIGVVLGNGRYFAPRLRVPVETVTYGCPKLLLQMRIEYDDGTVSEIVSDETWRITTDGPIRSNNDYDGEEYDARMELEGWCRPGFDDSGWHHADLVDPPGGALTAQMAEPIRVTETLHPVALGNPQPGVYVYDFGQNMVGWARLTVEGPRGSRISLRFAETIRDDGTLYLDNLRSCKVTDTYVLKGGGTEIYEPRFTYHGFRYVELCGFPGEPTRSTIEGRIVHSGVERIGNFSCSDDLVNRIYGNIVWGARGNLRSIPTDCPQRDERQGWLGDRAIVGKAESYDFNIARFYGKWLDDIQDAQDDKGSIPDLAPAYWRFYTDNVTWPGAYIIMPGWLYEQYGDRRMLETHFLSMKKWIDFMSAFVKDGIMPRDHYGDWCVPPESQHLIHSEDPSRKTNGSLLGTACFYHDLRLMVRYATILDRPREAEEFSALAERLRSAFNDRFFCEETHLYDNGTQTSSVLPLAFGMVPKEHVGAAVDRLVENIVVTNEGHLATGLVGGQWLMRVLAEHGHADVAWQLATQRSYPSWGYMVEHGATTIWELWNGDTADPAMNSHNHLMLVGDLGVWLYEHLAGIRPDPDQPGFKHIILCPQPVRGLDSASARHRSMYGTIVSDWRIHGPTLLWDVTVPPNATATLFVPTHDAEAVTEGGRPADEAEGVIFLRFEEGTAVYGVQAGLYSFAAPYSPDRKCKIPKAATSS